jgi:acetylornithine aminotransferase
VACAAALAVLDVVTEEQLVERSASLGERLAASISELGHDGVKEVRGRGLLRAVGLTSPVAKDVERLAREAGFLVNAIGDDTIRLVPPLILTEGELDSFVVALPGLLSAAAGATGR